MDCKRKNLWYGTGLSLFGFYNAAFRERTRGNDGDEPSKDFLASKFLLIRGL